MSMQKGKWHKVNGKLVKRRGRPTNHSDTTSVNLPKILLPEQREPLEMLANRWWDGLSLDQKIRKALT